MKRDVLEIQRRLWQYEESPGLPGLRMLKDNVCSYDVKIGEEWYHKTNVGRGNRWLIKRERCSKPDIIVYFKAELDYPFCFGGCKTTNELISVFKREAEKGNIWFEPRIGIDELKEKNYPNVAEILGLRTK